MATQVASLFARLTLEDSQYRQGLSNAQRGLQGLGSGLQSLGNRMTGAGMALTAMTAPIAAFGVQGVRAASSFEDAMRAIQVRAGLTEEELQAVNDKAMQIGRDSVYGPSQAADAFLQLLTSGSSVEEAMIQIDAVIAGAAASGEDLGFTADALTDIMAALGVETSQSMEVMQSLTNASGASSATFSDLVQGFQNVGGMARQMGLDVDDTAAILAVFSENGIKGAEGGTQLRSMLNNMTRDTSATLEAWNRIGVSLFDAEGNMRDLNTVVAEMNVAMADFSDEARVRTIQDIAGSYGQLGLSALLANDGFGDMQASMREGADISDIAAARLDTFSGAVALLQGSIETLSINALTPLMNNVLRPFLGRVNDVVVGINEWATANPEAAETLGNIGLAAVALGPALMIGGRAVNALGGFLSSMGVKGGVAALAIVALNEAFIKHYPGGFSQMLSDAATAAQQLVFLGLHALNEAASSANDFFSDLGTTIYQLGVIGLPGLGEAVTEVANNAMQDLVDAAGDAYHAVSDLGEALLGIERGVESTGRLGAAAAAAGKSPLSPSAFGGRKAAGGSVLAGVPYMVGERGPELFTPNTGGNITPNHMMGNAVTINVYQQRGENGESLARRVADLVRVNG